MKTKKSKLLVGLIVLAAMGLVLMASGAFAVSAPGVSVSLDTTDQDGVYKLVVAVNNTNGLTALSTAISYDNTVIVPVEAADPAQTVTVTDQGNDITPFAMLLQDAGAGIAGAQPFNANALWLVDGGRDCFLLDAYTTAPLAGAVDATVYEFYFTLAEGKTFADDVNIHSFRVETDKSAGSFLYAIYHADQEDNLADNGGIKIVDYTTAETGDMAVYPRAEGIDLAHLEYTLIKDGVDYSKKLVDTPIPTLTSRIGAGGLSFAIADDNLAVGVAGYSVQLYDAAGETPVGDPITLTAPVKTGAFPLDATVVAGTYYTAIVTVLPVTGVTGQADYFFDSVGAANSILSDAAEAAPRTAVAVSGQVKSYDPKNPVTVTAYLSSDTTHSNPQATASIAALSSGSGQQTQAFSIDVLPNATYDLVISKQNHLAYTIKGIAVTDAVDLTISTNPQISLITLLCGDINGDDYINDTDLNLVWNSANYGKEAGNAANLYTNVNGDGYVNDTDLNLVWNSANYGKSQASCIYTY